jgi:hypothetical protein
MICSLLRGDAEQAARLWYWSFSSTPAGRNCPGRTPRLPCPVARPGCTPRSRCPVALPGCPARLPCPVALPGCPAATILFKLRPRQQAKASIVAGKQAKPLWSSPIERARSVFTREQLIDLMWRSSIAPVSRQRYPPIFRENSTLRAPLPVVPALCRTSVPSHISNSTICTLTSTPEPPIVSNTDPSACVQLPKQLAVPATRYVSVEPIATQTR